MPAIYDPLAGAGTKPAPKTLPLPQQAAMLMEKHRLTCTGLFDAYKALQAGVESNPDYTPAQVVSAFGAVLAAKLYPAGTPLPAGKTAKQVADELGAEVYKSFQRTAVMAKAVLIAGRPEMAELFTDSVPAQPLADAISQYLTSLGL